MAGNPKTTYDCAVFRAALRRRAQWSTVTRRDMLDAFWDASPELRAGLLAKGGEAMVLEAEAKIRNEVLDGLQWQLDEERLRIREDEPA